MREFLVSPGGTGPKRPRLADGGSGGRSEDKPVLVHVEGSPVKFDALPDGALKKIADALIEMRVDAQAEMPDALDFYFVVRGGKWTFQHKRKIADTIMCKCRGAAPKAWATLWKWPRCPSFAFLKFGGRRNATMLAVEFTRRSQYFYNIWFNSEMSEDDFHYTPEQLEGYEVDPHWAAFLLEFPIDSSVFVRGHQIVNLRPRQLRM